MTHTAEPIVKLKLSPTDAVAMAIELRLLMVGAGIEKFEKDHPVRVLEKKLLDGSMAAMELVL